MSVNAGEVVDGRAAVSVGGVEAADGVEIADGVELADGVETADGVAGRLGVEPGEKREPRVLIVDDDRTLCDSCATVLRVEGYVAEVCYRGEDALRLLRSRTYDIVLIDLYLPQVTGMDLLRECNRIQPHAIVIVITGNPSVESSLEALRAGAWDYLPKPFSGSHLQLLIGRAAHAVSVACETDALARQLGRSHGHSDELGVVGVSESFRRVIELARKVARTDASVFITGESGTGKELIARLIHEHSRRSSRSLVAVNGAALPGTLLESEMLGHVKGAFTGAVQDKAGLLEEANGGTLFLDELAEMEPALQAKLLRVIQDGVVRRVGSTKTDAVVNVRFIAAMNRDPEEAIQAGALRRDLYFRLNVIPVRLPPLRERRSDIPILARLFLAHFWKRHRESRSPTPVLTGEAIESLQARHWSGNVRELQNVIERAVVLVEPGAAIMPEDLPPGEAGRSVDRRSDPSDLRLVGELIEGNYHAARDRLINEFERRYLARLVDLAEGNLSRAARTAGVDRTTLYRLMDKHGLTVQRLIGAQSPGSGPPSTADA